MVPMPLDAPRCEDIIDRLSEFLDGELDAVTAGRVALHLGLCTSCARFAAELAATVQALHQLGSWGCRCGTLE